MAKITTNHHTLSTRQKTMKAIINILTRCGTMQTSCSHFFLSHHATRSRCRQVVRQLSSFRSYKCDSQISFKSLTFNIPLHFSWHETQCSWHARWCLFKEQRRVFLKAIMCRGSAIRRCQKLMVSSSMIIFSHLTGWNILDVAEFLLNIGMWRVYFEGDALFGLNTLQIF